MKVILSKSFSVNAIATGRELFVLRNLVSGDPFSSHFHLIFFFYRDQPMVETLRLDQISIMQKVLSKGHNTVVVLKNIFLRI